MLPSEPQRNKNQRLIPLSQDLIHDMLNNEGLEYQTPPGAHFYNSEQNGNKGTCIHHNLGEWTIESQRLNLNSKQSDSNSRQTTGLTSDSIDSLYSDTVAERASSSTSVTESTNLKNLVDILHSVKEINNQKDAEAESDNLIDVLNSVDRLRSQNCDVTSLCCHFFIKDLGVLRRLYFDEDVFTRDNILPAITYSQESLNNEIDAETVRSECGPIRSSCGLHYVRSDSLITKVPQDISLLRNYDECNQYRINHHWVNVMAVNKSETSFLLNQHKLQNFKANSCNAYYTAESKDLRRDHEAVASLLAAPKCKRNYRNVY